MANYLFKGLCHVGIMTDNAEESVKWYCEKLGFRPWYAGKMGPMPLTFVEGYGLVIEVISAGKMAPGGPIAHIALEVLNIEDAVADLRAKGVNVPDPGCAPDFFPSGMKNVFFTGPNGETLEYVEYAK